jgi:hypothetical protein
VHGVDLAFGSLQHRAVDMLPLTLHGSDSGLLLN